VFGRISGGRARVQSCTGKVKGQEFIEQGSFFTGNAGLSWQRGSWERWFTNANQIAKYDQY
jgi:hypothetical protein